MRIYIYVYITLYIYLTSISILAFIGIKYRVYFSPVRKNAFLLLRIYSVTLIFYASNFNLHLILAGFRLVPKLINCVSSKTCIRNIIDDNH